MTLFAIHGYTNSGEQVTVTVNLAELSKAIFDEPMLVARCPEHGLHGERDECFVCGGPVEQVPVVPVLTLGEAS